MSFKDEYTTDEILLRKGQASMMVVNGTPEVLVDDEAEKTIISNDAYAIGCLLETLINTMRRN